MTTIKKIKPQIALTMKKKKKKSKKKKKKGFNLETLYLFQWAIEAEKKMNRIHAIF